MTVATIFGDTSDGTNDSAASGGASYGNASGLFPSAPTSDNTGTALNVGQSVLNVGPGAWHCYESGIAFVLTSIPGTASVSSVLLSLYATSVNFSASDNASWTNEVTDRDWGPTYDTNDFIKQSVGPWGNIVASLGNAGMTASAYNTITENGSALQTLTISKIGATMYLSMNSDRHRNGQNPGLGKTAYEYTSWTAADNTGTTQDPKLVVTYTVPSVPNAPTGLSVTPRGIAQLDVSWVASAVDGSHDAASTYKVERSTDGKTFSEIVTGVVTTTYSDTTVPLPGTIYYYRARATNATGDSGYSNFDWAATMTQRIPPANHLRPGIFKPGKAR